MTKLTVEKATMIFSMLSPCRRKIPRKRTRQLVRIFNTKSPDELDAWILEGERIVAESEAKRSAIG